jgi:hypothetical protein
MEQTKVEQTEVKEEQPVTQEPEQKQDVRVLVTGLSLFAKTL